MAAHMYQLLELSLDVYLSEAAIAHQSMHTSQCTPDSAPQPMHTSPYQLVLQGLSSNIL
jgi:hypothetical protein